MKGGEFLIKNEQPQDIFIPEEFNEEQKMIADMTKEFLQNEVLPNLDRIDMQEEGLMVSLLDKAGELGLLSTSIPEDLGGFGKDFTTNTLLTEVLGAGHAFPVSLLAHTGIGTLPILYFGTEAQKQKYLPKLATGELKACYCLTEPGSGSDALAAKTKAVLSQDGSHYIINGQKMWITNAGFADVFIVFAQLSGENLSEGKSGFTGFILERTMEGLSVGEEEHKMGIKGSSTRQVFFENVKVPKENLLGEAGKGHLIAFNILNIGRFKLCAATLGASKQTATISVKYANERNQFKQPISNFGAIQYKLAEQAIRIYACESAMYRVSEYIKAKEEELTKAGKNFNEALMGAAQEYAAECAMLKVFGSEVLDYVTDEGVQIHGGYGFSEEYPVARAYRDSRINRIFEGTNEINRMLTIDTLLKRAVKKELELFSSAKAVQKELTSISSFLDMKGNKEEGIFKEEIYAIKNAKKAVLMTLGAAAGTYKEKLATEQEIMMHCADMIIDVFAAESTLLRTQKLINIKGEDAVKEQIAMTKVFTSTMMDKIRLAGKNAIISYAKGDNIKRMLWGLKKLTRYKSINVKDARRSVAAKLISENKYCY